MLCIRGVLYKYYHILVTHFSRSYIVIAIPEQYEINAAVVVNFVYIYVQILK